MFAAELIDYNKIISLYSMIFLIDSSCKVETGKKQRGLVVADLLPNTCNFDWCAICPIFRKALYFCFFFFLFMLK
jgi:hypothetical protein